MSEKSKILVADDEEIMRDVLSALLAGENYIVELAENGGQALAMLRDNTYDVMLLDLLMPDMDGFSLLSNMRSTANLQDIPVIILTGADLTSEQHQKLTEFGQQLLSKGYLREKELLSTIEQTLRRIHPMPAAS